MALRDEFVKVRDKEIFENLEKRLKKSNDILDEDKCHKYKNVFEREDGENPENYIRVVNEGRENLVKEYNKLLLNCFTTYFEKGRPQIILKSETDLKALKNGKDSIKKGYEKLMYLLDRFENIMGKQRNMCFKEDLEIAQTQESMNQPVSDRNDHEVDDGGFKKRSSLESKLDFDKSDNLNYGCNIGAESEDSWNNLGGYLQIKESQEWLSQPMSKTTVVHLQELDSEPAVGVDIVVILCELATELRNSIQNLDKKIERLNYTITALEENQSTSDHEATASEYSELKKDQELVRQRFNEILSLCFSTYGDNKLQLLQESKAYKTSLCSHNLEDQSINQ